MTMCTNSCPMKRKKYNPPCLLAAGLSLVLAAGLSLSACRPAGARQADWDYGVLAVPGVEPFPEETVQAMRRQPFQFESYHITAAYNNGVLELTLPKAQPVVPAARQIDIQ